MLDDSDGLRLLTGVSPVELEGTNQSLDDGAEGLPELLLLVPAGGVGDVHLRLGGLDGDVVGETGILDLDLFVVPLAEQEGLIGEESLGSLLGLGNNSNFSHEFFLYLYLGKLKAFRGVQ